MELEQALANYWLQIRKRKEEKKRHRVYWIHPILRDWSEKELFVTHYANLRANPDKFFLLARMSISSFNKLLSYLPNPEFPVQFQSRKYIFQYQFLCH